MGFGPGLLVVVDVAVAGGAAGDAAQRGQVAVLDRDVEVLDRRADLSSCETAGVESRVSSTVPSTATAASAAMTSISAITQPQLRRFAGGLGASPRGGIPVVQRVSGVGAGCRGDDLGGRLGRGVDPLGRPGVEAEGAVNRRSGLRRSPVGPPAAVRRSGDDMISGRGFVSRSWDRDHLGGGLGPAASGRRARPFGRPAPATSSVASSGWSGPDGFDIPAAVLR